MPAFFGFVPPTILVPHAMDSSALAVACVKMCQHENSRLGEYIQECMSVILLFWGEKRNRYGGREVDGICTKQLTCFPVNP